MKSQKIQFTRILAISAVTIVLATGCLEKEEEQPSTGGGTTTTNKATLSSWATSNAAWAFRLDLSGANIAGTPFTMVIKYSDSSETHCSATLSGTEASGSYTVSSCATTMPGSGNMSDSTTASSFHTGGAGTYVNNGSSFYWCRANSSCFTYY